MIKKTLNFILLNEKKKHSCIYTLISDSKNRTETVVFGSIPAFSFHMSRKLRCTGSVGGFRAEKERTDAADLSGKPPWSLLSYLSESTLASPVAARAEWRPAVILSPRINKGSLAVQQITRVKCSPVLGSSRCLGGEEERRGAQVGDAPALNRTLVKD